jgi:hypothetical protein
MRGAGRFPNGVAAATVERGRGGTMKWLLCRVLGHQRTLMAFTSNRFSCRRCGTDLGRDIPAMPGPSAAAPALSAPRVSASARGSTRQRSLRFHSGAGGTSRPHARP